MEGAAPICIHKKWMTRLLKRCLITSLYAHYIRYNAAPFQVKISLVKVSHIPTKNAEQAL